MISYLDRLMVLFHNFSFENIIMLILGTAAYFIFEYKAGKKEKTFSWKVWWNENNINIAATMVCTMIFFVLKDNVSQELALGIGMAPNWTVDKILEIRRKFVLKEPEPKE